MLYAICSTFVNGQLGFKRIFLVGHDFGGAVAYAYAVDHPEDVRRFAFLDYVLSGFGFEEAMIPRRDGKNLWVAALHVVRDIPEVLVAGKERFYLSQIFRGQFAYNPYAISEADIDEYTSRYCAPGGLRGLFEYYRATWENADQNKENAKRKLTMPMLALEGECSLGENVMLSMKTVAKDMRGGVVERCGHWIPDERPDYLTQQLLAFFGEDQSS